MSEARAAALVTLREVARESHPPLRLRGQQVIGLRHTNPRGDILPPGRSCWAVFLRSVLVQIVLPAEKDADVRGNPWFYVARVTGAWVVWDKVH
jgi:hypothetical protein